jgi:3-methyl-2-oxobutanoate hydroxymethyltransferase
VKIDELRRLKGVRKVTMLTAYDQQMAGIMDRAGLDVILVGDSLGMVVLGYKDTKHVTMEDMVRHTEAVARGVESALVVADMPIGTYGSPGDALTNTRRLMDAGADAVKLEGNCPQEVRALISSGIPVMGHLGLLPQTAEEMRVKGKKTEEAERMVADARELDELGVFSIVLECIPLKLAKRITESVGALTIGIGAGVYCDGQVLVVNDMLGMDRGYSPKHSKVYVDLNSIISDAVKRYMEDVRSGRFPEDKQSFH